ncbi:radical SAM protein [Vibrio lamellibrachiae]|uniref:radical SAM protein n=1 Tax=Vibrio lamellibrachiae TaxID=2910253 RepID=UPI003D0D3E73
MRYEGNIYRPPPEEDAYILQCTIGCSHNRCTYCAMYKDVRYRVRSIEELKEDIQMAKTALGRNVEKAFLSDGDAISLPTDMLLEILAELKAAFPKLRHVSTYAAPQSTLDKTAQELNQLKQAGLTMMYLGVESGSDDVLKDVRKGVNVEQMRQAGQNIVNAGISLVAMVMLGLGGSGPQSKEHAKATAELINQMNPDFLGLLTTVPIEGTALFRKVTNSDFILLDPYEVLEEIQVMLETLSNEAMIIDSTHGSNLLSIRGTVGEVREMVLEKINHLCQNKDDSLIGQAYVGRF